MRLAALWKESAMKKPQVENPNVVPMLRVADIAKRLALSADHVRERIVTRADFPAPAFQIGCTRRWEAAHVERWIAARQRQHRRVPSRKVPATDRSVT